MKICEDPEILNILYIFKTIIMIGVIVSVVLLIIFVMLDIIKLISSSDVDTKKGLPKIMKRVVAMAMVFLVPSILGIVLNFAGETLNYGSCLDNANKTYISESYANKAEELLKMAEDSKSPDTLYKAQKYVKKIKDERLKASMQLRADAVKAYIDEINRPDNMPDNNTGSSGNYPTVPGNCGPGAQTYVNTSEPDPSCALKYWSNVININNFVYKKDDSGQSLGAWPSNYNSIPTQLSNPTRYYSGTIIWPTTSENNGLYKFVYEHKGIDIMAPIGTPIYSPVNGTLAYSKWGETKNKRSDETSYTVEIIMDTPVNVDSKQVDKVFLTHMAGIRYRCNGVKDCNRKVKQGELLGYVGNAANGGGYAPHLHMSYFQTGNYNSINITTSGIEKMYNISSGKIRKAGE